MPVEMTVLKDRVEWLKHRKRFIGGSDAAAVIGQNPYKTNVDLWEEKLELVSPEDISNKPCVQFGVDAEPIIRELFKLSYPQYKVEYIDNNSWTNSKYPFAAVSHDGWITEIATDKKGIWECKTTEIMTSAAKAKWDNQISNNYYVQLIHSLMIREDCEFAHLTALLTYKIKGQELYQQVKNYHIERSDVVEDIEYLAEKEAEFWEYIKLGKRPNLILPSI